MGLTPDHPNLVNRYLFDHSVKRSPNHQTSPCNQESDKYSKFEPAPRTPSSMQRSYLLSIDFKVTSITEWAAQLKINPLYAILSGFEPDNTPGVGTFYDFINRLWNSDDDHMSPHIHPLKGLLLSVLTNARN